MKRLLFFICTLLCANVLFAQTRFWIGDIQYEITSTNPAEVEVNYANYSITTAIIPSTVTYNGTNYNITSIGYAAFLGCDSLTSVTIPNSVTSIGREAFDSCSSLTSVTIGNSVTSIGDRAFRNCSSLTSVTIPNSVTSIREDAFKNCSSLTTLNYNAINCNDFVYYHNYPGPFSGLVYHHQFLNCPITTINIGDSVQRIPADFAYDLDSLTSITIPNSVTSIGGAAFSNCSSLTSVTIPDSVISIGNGAFGGCSSLTSVTIPNSVTSIGNATFSGCSSLTSATIGNSVTFIGNSAFRSCSSLTSVTIPDSVTYIGDYAFGGCSSLTSVTIPDSVTSIGDGTFASCSSLTSVTIPNSVTSIGEEAFRGCISLTSVTIPNSVTSIGGAAFYGCSSLTSVILSNNITELPCYVAGYYHYYGFFENCSSLTSVTIPNSVTSIGTYAFKDCSSLTSVTIPNSVTSIGGGVFYNCSSLTSVTLSNNITELPCYYDWRNFFYGFFHDCSSLTSITIPNSVTSIGDYAFAGCSSLTSATIGDSVTSIGQEAFRGCNSLTSVTIGNSVTSIGNDAFYNCSSLTSVTIPNSVTSIGDYAFGGCSSLTSVTIGNSVTSIGSSAFRNCSSLTSVTCLADIPPALGNNVFNNTPSNKILYVNCGLKDDYISSWGDYFNSNNIHEIPFDINTYVNNESGGSVAIERNNCSTATLTATANICYQFVRWNDGNIENPRIIELTNDTTFTAIFEDLPNHNYNVNISINNDAFGSVSIENDCNSSTLTATANNCYQFVSWNDGNTENPRVVNVSSDTSLTANFEEINYNTELSATICQGQVYNENGFNVSEAGVYTQTLTSVNGCDSIVTLSLNVNPTFNTELSANICQGQVYNENGFNVSEAGVYTQTLTSVNGCDSIVTLSLNVNPTFDTTINATINAGETYAEFGFNESEAGTYVQNLQTEAGCDSTITLVLSVNSSLIDIEETEITFYPNPTDSKITFSQKIEKVEVIDLTGKTIFTFSNVKTINIESLPSGAYYLRLTNEEKTTMQKVIKQ